MSEIGFVYLLSNDSMPGIYKIGMTKRPPSVRAAELSASTSAPKPFRLLCYGEHENARATELEIHALLSCFRVNHGREFFSLDIDGLETAEDLIRACALSYADVDLHVLIHELQTANLPLRVTETNL